MADCPATQRSRASPEPRHHRTQRDEGLAGLGARPGEGPDDPHPEVDDERLRLVLRDIFSAAGGTHDDWATYDRVMREERRTAVFVSPTRVYANPG